MAGASFTSCETFSSRLIRLTRSAARWSAGRSGFRYGGVACLRPEADRRWRRGPHTRRGPPLVPGGGGRALRSRHGEWDCRGTFTANCRAGLLACAPSGIISTPQSRRVLGSPESTLVLLEQIRAGDDAALDLLLRRIPAPPDPMGTRPPAPMGCAICPTRKTSFRRRSLLRSGTSIQFELRGDGALHAYLRRAMLNRIRDELRRHSRRGSAGHSTSACVCAEDSPPRSGDRARGRRALRAGARAAHLRRARGDHRAHRAGTDLRRGRRRARQADAGSGPDRSTARSRGWRALMP